MQIDPDFFLWLQSTIVSILTATVQLLDTRVTVPLWALPVSVMFGALISGGRGARGKASRAYQRIKVRFSR